jgi:hypothetical protein
VKARSIQLWILLLLMLGVSALTFLPRRDNGPSIEPRSGPALRLISLEAGKPDPMNITITLEWIGKGFHELSIGQPLPGTTLRFFGMKRSATSFCILRSADNTKDVVVGVGGTVWLPADVLK